MNWRLVIPVTFAVLVIWVVGAAVTKYSLEQMAYLAPIAVVVVGVQVGLDHALGQDHPPVAATSDARGATPAA